jgi:hypothetical protein
LQTKSAAIELDPIRLERDYYRNIFWAAYNLFQSHADASVPANLPDGCYTQTGGPHDPAWECWARWRADFHLCGQTRLPEIEERIFTLHMCLGISERDIIFQMELGSYNTLVGYKSMIAEKMGHFLENTGLWPITAYLENGVPQNVYTELSNNGAPFSGKAK